MNMPPVFCVSLARDAKRRAQMSARLDALGVRYEMVDAVDGRALDLSALGDRLRQDKSVRKMGRELLPGEIGCYLSHYNLWERIVAEKIPAAVVAEDDAVFCADFSRIAAAAANIPHEWDAIAFHNSGGNGIAATLCELDGEYSVCRMKKQHLNTTCYLVSLAGAKKLLTHYREISEPADRTFSQYWNGGIKFYVVRPAIVRVDGSPTTIAEYDKIRVKSPLTYLYFVRKCGRWRERIKKRIYDFRNPLSREIVRAKNK